MSGKRFKKSVWLPLVIALYAAAMSCYFGPTLIAEGRASKFWISVAFEAVVVIALFFFLRRKERLKERWTTDRRIRGNDQ